MRPDITAYQELVSWSLTSLFSTNMAISEAKPIPGTKVFKTVGFQPFLDVRRLPVVDALWRCL